MKHIGWFILDKNGLVFLYLPKQMYFFGEVVDKKQEIDIDQRLRQIDEVWAGLAPHKIVRAYCEEGVQ